MHFKTELYCWKRCILLHEIYYQFSLSFIGFVSEFCNYKNLYLASHKFLYYLATVAIISVGLQARLTKPCTETMKDTLEVQNSDMVHPNMYFLVVILLFF